MADKIAEHMKLAVRWASTGRTEDQAALEASARALAQGEPGEAFGTYVEYSDGTTAFRKRGEPFAPTVLGGTVWTLYLSPTASAPAAEREPLTNEQISFLFAKMKADPRSANFTPEHWYITGAAAQEFHLCGIGTKEPSNG